MPGTRSIRLDAATEAIVEDFMRRVLKTTNVSLAVRILIKKAAEHRVGDLEQLRKAYNAQREATAELSEEVARLKLQLERYHRATTRKEETTADLEDYR